MDKQRGWPSGARRESDAERARREAEEAEARSLFEAAAGEPAPAGARIVPLRG